MEGNLFMLTGILLKGAALLIIAAVVTPFMRRSSAATRHLVWTSAVVSILVLPFLALLLPTWSPRPVTQMVESVQPRIQAPPKPTVSFADTARLATEPVTPPSSPAAPAPEARSEHGGKIAKPPAPAPSFDLEQFTVNALFCIWLVGGLLTLIPLVLGWCALFRLKRSATSVEAPEWHALLTDLRGTLKMTPKVRLLMSPACRMPMTWGVLPGRATIIVPPEAVSTWSIGRRRAVLLHELAHVKRGDCLTQTVAQIACALHWCNPLVWLARRQMLVERERACDDLALSHKIKPAEYADHLLNVAATPRSHLFTDHAAVAMARSSNLGERVVAILDRSRNRAAITISSILLAIALIGVVATPIAMLRAEVDTESPPSDSTVSATPLSSNEENLRLLSGRLVDSHGNPIAGAILTVQAITRHSITTFFTGDRYDETEPLITDDNGEFQFKHETPFTSAILLVQAEGFAPFQTERLTTGDHSHTLTLGKGASIIGRVVREDQPIAGVEMRMRALTGGAHDYNFLPDQATISDENGTFRFSNIPQSHEHILFGTMESLQGIGSIPMRPITSGADGSVLDLGDVRIEAGYSVEGKVRLVDGGDPSGLQIRITRGESDSGFRSNEADGISVETDEEGRFGFTDIPPENIFIRMEENEETYSFTLRNPSADPAEPQRLGGRITEDVNGLILEIAPRIRPSSFGEPLDPNAPLRGAEQYDAAKDLLLSGIVVDADTGTPLESFRLKEGRIVSEGGNFRNDFAWTFSRTQTYPDGKFSLRLPYSGEQAAGLRIEADGYVPFEIGPLTESADMHIPLQRSDGLSGVVLDIDGQPAAGVTVFRLDVRSPSIDLTGDLLDFGRIKPQHRITDENGRFTFPPAPVDDLYSVAAVSEEGYGEVKVISIKEEIEIPLQRWARVEGQFFIGSEPQANERIRVGLSYIHTKNYADPDSNSAIPADIYPRPNSPVAISRMVLTDENGRFTFDRLPPNLPIGLYHDPQQIRGDHSGPLSARKVAFIAMPGKTHKIKMGGNGRPVTGRIVVEGYEGPIDWEDELQRIYIPDWADDSLPNLGKLVCEYDEAFRSAPDDESRQAVVDRYEPLRKEALRLHREKEFEKPTYFFRISKDGRFHIEDMRPGKYIFRPAVSGPTLNQMHTLHIPESREGNPNAPYDVGDLVFTHEPLPPHLRLW